MSKLSGGTEAEEPLREGANGVFQTERPTRDKGWSIACLCCIVLTLGVGLYAVANRSSDANLKNTPEHLAKPQSCPYPGRKLQETLNQEDSPSSSGSFFWQLAVGIALSTAGSLGLGVLYILICKRAPHLVVHGTFVAYIATFVLCGVVQLLAFVAAKDGSSGGFSILAVVYFAAAVVIVCIYRRWRDEVALCSRLLGVSTVGLKCNPGLVLFVLAVKVVELYILLPIAMLVPVALQNNGHVVPSGARQGTNVCYDANDKVTPCCKWQSSTWASFYAAFAISTMVWLLFIARQLRTFVISGTIAQWYYSPVSRASSTKGNTRRSIDHAMGPALGTLCCGGFILLIVEYIRAAMHRIWILRLFANLFESVASHLTKFAVIMASISGEDLVTAGKDSTSLLLRNCMKSFGVWWIPPFIMKSSAAFVAFIWTLIVYCIQVVLIVMANVTDDEVEKSRLWSAAIICFATFWISWLVLSFFGSILLNIVDATYLCYAIDRDTQTITKQEIHDVFSQVPIGAAVEQPDGELQYGNPGVYNYVPPSDPDAAQPVQNNATRV